MRDLRERIVSQGVFHINVVDFIIIRQLFADVTQSARRYIEADSRVLGNIVYSRVRLAIRDLAEVDEEPSDEKLWLLLDQRGTSELRGRGHYHGLE